MDSAGTATKHTSIKEGKAEILLKTDQVFYNPVQEFNRDLSIAVLTIFTNDYKAEQLVKNEKFAKTSKYKEKVDTEVCLFTFNNTNNTCSSCKQVLVSYMKVISYCSDFSK